MALSSLLAVAQPASAQDTTAFLMLGEDPVGDPSFQGQAMADTWIDINHLSVATVGTDLVFHLGLKGTTTEAGSYCWMAAFEFDDTEYVGLDCYEGAAYESDNTASTVRPATTSRGTNVASSVVFDATGAVITIPLAAIGASVGDVIEDVYGLTYFSRALYAVDTIPDAKSDAAADESLGTYRLGGGEVGSEARSVVENLTTPFFLHEFANATSDDYSLNFTVEWTNATMLRSAAVVSGSANVTILRNGTVFLAFLLTNETAPGTGGNATAGNASGNATLGGNQTALVEGAAGNWSIAIDYEAFVGRFSLGFEAYEAPPVASSNVTTSPGAPAGNQTVEEGSEDTPGPGLVLVVIGFLAAVAVRRRR